MHRKNDANKIFIVIILFLLECLSIRSCALCMSKAEEPQRNAYHLILILDHDDDDDDCERLQRKSGQMKCIKPFGKTNDHASALSIHERATVEFY